MFFIHSMKIEIQLSQFGFGIWSCDQIGIGAIEGTLCRANGCDIVISHDPVQCIMRTLYDCVLHSYDRETNALPLCTQSYYGTVVLVLSTIHYTLYTSSTPVLRYTVHTTHILYNCTSQQG